MYDPSSQTLLLLFFSSPMSGGLDPAVLCYRPHRPHTELRAVHFTGHSIRGSEGDMSYVLEIECLDTAKTRLHIKGILRSKIIYCPLLCYDRNKHRAVSFD